MTSGMASDPVGAPLALQFETAEWLPSLPSPSSPASLVAGVLAAGGEGVAQAPVCGRCRARVGESYYVVRGHVVCGECAASVQRAMRPTGPLIARAVAFGLLGSVLGGALYYAIVARRGYPMGLIAVAVGYLIARAVQIGARGRRGPAFQAIAVGLTYLAVGAAYVPVLTLGDAGAWSLSGAAFRAVAAPVLVSVAHLPTSLINGVIVVVALVPGLLMTRAPSRGAVDGPFRLGPGVSAPGPLAASP